MTELYPQEVLIAREVITHFEGCRLKSYIVPGEEKMQATIGWGQAISLKQHPMQITQALADIWLMNGILSRWHALKEVELKTIWADLNVFEKAAILSFRYNAVTSLWLTSNSRKLLLGGDVAAYADSIDEWDNHDMAGLVRRRAVERHLTQRHSLDEVKKLNWYNDLVPAVAKTKKAGRTGHLVWAGERLIWKAA